MPVDAGKIYVLFGMSHVEINNQPIHTYLP